MRHRFAVLLLALGAAVVALVVATGSGAARTAPSGIFTLKAGQTIHFNNLSMNGSGGSLYEFVEYYVGTTATDPSTDGTAYNLWSDYGTSTTQSFSNTTYTNETGGTVYVELYLQDANGGYATYFSNHTSRNTTAAADHAATGWVKGKAAISINDSGTNAANKNVAWVPTLGHGNFNTTVTITKN